MRQQIITDNAVQVPDLLSQAIVCGDVVWTSGFIHSTPDTDELVHGTVAQELDLIMQNLSAVL